MRHLKGGRKLSRTSAHRRALFRNLVAALIEHERIQTTDAKAKAIRPLAERMISLAKRGTLHARRQALAFIRRKAVVRKLFEEVGPRFRDRPGGYTRIVKMGRRRGDAALLSIIELTERGEQAKSEAQRKRERKQRARERRASGG